VCLFSAQYLRNDAARITKLNTEMLHGDFWKSIYLEVKRFTNHKNVAGMGHCTVLVRLIVLLPNIFYHNIVYFGSRRNVCMFTIR